MMHSNRNLAQSLPMRRSAGFTLLEIVLVLTIIATVSAIAIPALSEIFERQKLRGAVEEIRLKFDESRLEAMRTGQAQVFECVPGSSGYSFKPLVMQDDILNAAEGATIVNAGRTAELQDYGMMGAVDPAESQTEQLEDNITFVQCLVAGDMRSYSVAQESQMSMTGANDVTTMNVGQKVIFYPDGSTSTAEVQIRNVRGDIQAVQIRGLTGHTRALEVTNVPSDDDS